MTGVAVSLPSIRPRPRSRELVLLIAVGISLVVGWASLASYQAGVLTVGDPRLIGFYLGLVAVVHLAFVITGRRTDQVLLPAMAFLGGLSLLLMQRLPQDLVVQELGGVQLPLAPLQLVWLTLALAITAGVGILVRNDGWLRYYKYSWAAAGIGLLLLVFLLGEETNGARLSVRLGPLQGQPSELLKVILVIFLAAYLADNRALLARTSTRFGPFRLPPVPYLLPMVAMWGIALAVVIVQRDLGAALLFFSIFLGMLYAATQRVSYVVLGMALFLVGSVVLYLFFGHVRDRVDIWIDPFADPQGTGYQMVRSLYAFGRGGVLGTGLGAGLPTVGQTPAIPAIHTDFVFAALGEELGLLGAVAILAVYLVIAERGMRIAAGSADDFRGLLAAGLTLVIAIQAAIIVGGNLKLVPLTGITLPFVSYGGSSLLANAIVIGLLLALSDRGVEPPAAPRASARQRFRESARRMGERIEGAVS